MAVAMGEPVIQLRDVTFSYSIFGNAQGIDEQPAAAESRIGGVMRRIARREIRVCALDELTLDIRAGQRLGVLGRNGAGKSTLLRVIAGIYPPESGQVSVRGTVATVFDKMLGMDQELSGLENIYVRGMFMGLSHKQIKARVEEIAAFSELGPFLKLPVRVYSSGMRARLGFAVSTAFDADILLLDEWLGVGDRDFVEKAKVRMQDFYKRAGTVVLVSHNENLIRDNCDSVVVLEQGRIVEQRLVEPKPPPAATPKRKAAAAA